MYEKETHILLGRNIRSLRTQYAVSKKALANLMHIPVGRLTDVERGKQNCMIFTCTAWPGFLM